MASAEDEDGDLEILVNQKLSRPTYTRVISRELTRTEEEKEQSRKSILKILETLNEDNELMSDNIQAEMDKATDAESVDSSDSEYHSASEDIPCLHDGCDELFDSDIDFGKQMQQQIIGRKRRHSSKRKAKWHRQEKKNELGFPFANIKDDDLQQSITSELAATSLTSTTILHKIQRPVQSLRDLCAKIVGSVHKDIPRSHTRDVLLGSHIEQNHEIASQLNRLQHLLHFFEQSAQHELSLPDHYSSRRLLRSFQYKDSNGKWKNCCRFLVPKRNLWEEDNLRECYNRTGTTERRGTRTLPCVKTLEDFNPNAIDALSALASLIRIMLPSHPPIGASAKGTCHKSDMEKLDRACLTAVTRINRHVKSRYPKLEEHLFATAVPYAWWSRGNLKQAERAFLKLVRECSNVEEQVMFLNEIARLHATCGDVHKCSKYLMAALEVLSTDKNAMKCPFAEEEVQSQVLHAAYMDCGMNTGAKALNSARLWSNLTYNADVPEACVQEAIASLICYHSGINPGFDKNIWQELETKLSKFAFHQGDLALSLLYAMQGKPAESLQAFRSYNSLFASGRSRGLMFLDVLPGRHFTEAEHMDEIARFYPFDCIAKQVRLTGNVIQLIKMIWRTHLSTPCLNFEQWSWSPTDFAYNNGSLWQSEDASITGDMLMMLPPLNNVKLCQFTGALRIGTFPEPPPLWNSTPIPSMGLKEQFVQIGAKTVYEDVKGCVILNIQTAPSRPDGYAYMVQCEAVYNGTDGTSAKINLKRSLRNCIKRKTEAEIRYNFKKKPIPPHRKIKAGTEPYFQYVFTDKWLQDMHDTLANFDKHGRDLSYDTINEHAESQFWKKYNQRTESKKDKKDRKQKIKNDNQKVPITTDRRLCIQLLCRQVVGKSVFLLFDDNRSACRYGQILVILSCQSSSSFEEHKLLHVHEVVFGSFDNRTEEYNLRWMCDEDKMFQLGSLFMIPKLEKNCHNIITEAAVLVADSLEKGKRIYRFYMINPQGDILLDWRGESLEDVPYTHVIDQTLYGIHPADRTRLICSRSDKSVISGHLPEIKDIEQVEDKLLVLTKKGICIIDAEFNTVPWKSNTDSVTISEDNVWLLGKFSKMSALLTKCNVSSRGVYQAPVNHTLLSLNNRVLLLESRTRSEETGFHCVLSFDVPGWATEACFVSEEVGILLASTLMQPDGLDKFYEENVYQFNYRGDLVGILPGLGKGPHTFLPLYQEPNPEVAKMYPEMELDEAAWYVYCRDGHGGISCFRPIE